MRTALVNSRVLTPEGMRSDRAVLLKDGHIEAVVGRDDARCNDARLQDLGGQTLVPGFIDTQVNGGGGVLFNDRPDAAAVGAIGAAHRQFGTTGFLPTLISDDLDAIANAIAAVRTAIATGVPGVLGIHIEGPFLSRTRRGVHDAKHLRNLDSSIVPLLCSLGGGKTLVTLAPEMTTPTVIAELTARGVIVAAGHSEATHSQTNQAIVHGLRGFTHLFNAMSPITPREPGMVGAALCDDSTWCGIIVDGHHVHPATLDVALRCKRHDRFVLVTDAMPVVGSGKDSFELQGRTIRVIDGVCRDDKGTLAGTAIDMASTVRNAVSMLGLELAEALRMASQYPADYLGLGHELGRIAPGYRANLALLDDALHVRRTWIDGVSSVPESE
jgi:N-acetylglucosamine-6-phosphate deacetylase